MVLQGAEAPFVRCDVIVRAGDGAGYALRRRGSTSALTQEDYELLCRTGEATPFPVPFPDVAGARIWAFRETLLQRENYLSEVRGLPWCRGEKVVGNVVLFLVDESKLALAKLEEWQQEAFNDGVAAHNQKRASLAVQFAKMAYCFAPQLDAECLGLLVACYQYEGRTERARAFVKMAENSRGQEFADHTMWRAQLPLLRHALGWTEDDGKTTRWCGVYEGSFDYMLCEGLERKGRMVRTVMSKELTCGGTCFVVTPEGEAWARLYEPPPRRLNGNEKS